MALKKDEISTIAMGELYPKLRSFPEKVIARAEDKFDNRLQEIAKDVASNVASHKFIMLAGPSSSGKTTTSLKLCSALAEQGVGSHVISLDNFFRSRKDIPLDEAGNPDVESPMALDAEKIADSFERLCKSEEVLMPRYNFITSMSEDNGKTLQLKENEILLVEGIHALSNHILDRLPPERLYCVYLGVRTNYSVENEIFLRKRHIRLLRRLVRDYQFRGASPELTFHMWDGVCRGEEKWIIPCSGKADVIIDTLLEYEPAVLKEKALPLLAELFTHPTYAEAAKMLSEKLSAFPEVDETLVPETSLVREFIGGSFYQD